jgi:hypothetical protein
MEGDYQTVVVNRTVPEILAEVEKWRKLGWKVIHTQASGSGNLLLYLKRASD